MVLMCFNNQFHFIARSNMTFMCSIYKLHDEAKDKAFELEMSWICEESKREHQKVKILLVLAY